MIEQLILTKEQLTQLRTYLGKHPYDIVAPVITFFDQLEALQLQKAEAEKELGTLKEES